ncbi:MAG TPA: SurA N-terminal domain-containing protein [Nevskiaceae bacterium]|nr:SurA N-terminal domain-containing protein [Nevskiaceae bacterium]
MRDRMAGPVVWGIVGLLCLVFAVWGIGASPIFGGGSSTLAKVGGVKITQDAYQQAYNRSYQQLLQMMGDNFNPNQIDQAKFRAGVLNDMIDRTLLQQYAQHVGYITTDGAVYDYLSQIPDFQKDGHFSADAYRAALARSGMAADQFESQIRQALSVQQLRDGVLNTAFVVPKQAQATWDVRNETRDVSQALFAPSQYVAKVKVTDDQVQAYYAAHKSDFIAPQRIKLAYVELSQATLPPAPAPSADVLKAIYAVQKTQRFKTPGQREISHILIRFGANKADALKKAQEVEAKLAAGGKFAALAKQYSDDPGSKDKGGALGWLSRGMMAPAFETAMYALAKPGDVSAPVKTQFGWDIIRLDGVRPSTVQPFTDPAVQAKLLETYRSRAAAKQFEADASRLASLVFESPNSLQPAAKALGLKVQHTDWLTHQGGTGVGSHPAVVDAAFSPGVAQDNQNSKPIPIGSADQVVVRKLEEQPERQMTLTEVTSRIHDLLVKQAATQEAQAAADAALKAVQSGKSLNAAVADAKLSVHKLAGLTRGGTQDKALLAAAFRIPQSASGAAKGSTVALLGNGDYAVLVLDAVHHPQPKAGSGQLTTAVQGYSQALAGTEFDAYQTAMRGVIKIKRENSPSSDDGQNPSD